MPLFTVSAAVTRIITLIVPVCAVCTRLNTPIFSRRKLEERFINYTLTCACAGKGYEEFYERVQGEHVQFIRGKLASITASVTDAEEDNLILTCEDTLLGNLINISVDMVVLCVALEPRHDAEQLSHILRLGRSHDGFFLERHPKLDPVATMSEGIFVVGCCQGPKDIPDTVAQASAASARALAMISKGKMETGAITAFVDEGVCSGCKVCNALCPYGAIFFDEPGNTYSVKSGILQRLQCMWRRLSERRNFDP